MERKVGFWNTHKDDYPELPLPLAREKPWKGRRDFLALLSGVENLIKGHQLGRINRYRGFSSCRCCGKANGSQEYTYNGFQWPEGFRHYIEEHNVKPPQDFIDFILSGHYSEKIKSAMTILAPADFDKVKKPKVDDLFNAHTRYQSRIMQAAHYTTSVTDYKRLFREAQLAFKADMEDLGLADQLDWSDLNLE